MLLWGMCTQVVYSDTAGGPVQDCLVVRGYATMVLDIVGPNRQQLLGTAACDTANYALCFWPQRDESYTALRCEFAAGV